MNSALLISRFFTHPNSPLIPLVGMGRVLVFDTSRRRFAPPRQAHAPKNKKKLNKNKNPRRERAFALNRLRIAPFYPVGEDNFCCSY